MDIENALLFQFQVRGSLEIAHMCQTIKISDIKVLGLFSTLGYVVNFGFPSQKKNYRIWKFSNLKSRQNFWVSSKSFYEGSSFVLCNAVLQ